MKVPHSHRYQLSSHGRKIAVLFTKAFGRVLAPGLTALDLRLPEDVAARSKLATAWRQLERAIDGFMEREMIAA